MRSDALEELRAALRQMLPAAAGSGAARLNGTAATLHEAELAATTRMSPRRLLEFRAGRAVARIALGELGAGSPPLPVGPSRAPVWPEGFVGSISHAGEVAVAVATRTADIRAIGIDLEPALPLDAELLRRVCLPAELARLRRSADMALRAKLTFSAKESVYKCLAPVTGIFLEFDDVEILFDSGPAEFSVRGHGPGEAAIGAEKIAGRFALAGGYWLTTAWLSPPHRAALPGSQGAGG
ncbi:MAG: 4'-phosphopantetheinyl transferase superfamily protein [Gammaproteobacteria bacterium]